MKLKDAKGITLGPIDTEGTEKFRPEKTTAEKYLEQKHQAMVDNAVDKAMGAFCRGLIFVGVTPQQIQQAALKAAEFKDD